MDRLSVIDTGFLLAEKRETPMHVGGVHLFTLPRQTDEQKFLRSLADNLRSADQYQSPFGDRLKMGRLGLMGPVYWEPDDALDIDYHIRHSALPAPGRYRELFALVSRLHGTLLDRHRPLWEFHLIEGLQDRQFAIYSKFHHAAIDGAKSMHLTHAMYSTDPDERVHYSPLSLEAGEHYRAKLRRHRVIPKDHELRSVAEVLKAQFDSGANIYSALKRFGGAWLGRGGALTVPFKDVPQSAINTPVDGARRFVAQSWPFARIRAVGKALDGTFNDAVLAMCSGALRRYLLSARELPKESLKAMVPISLRQAGDMDSSNAVSAITADLATNIKDPERRFRAIQASMKAGKELFEGLSLREATILMQLVQLPSLLLYPLGLTSRFPAYSTVISNVPGPRKTMYWNGARLEGMYPASIIFDGFALNITLVSYDKNVDFGITASRRTLPRVQRLIDYLEDELALLEVVAGIRAPGKASSDAPRKTVSKKKTKTVAKKKASKKTTAKKKVAKKKVAKKKVARKVAKKVTRKKATAKTATRKPATKKRPAKKTAGKKATAKKTTRKTAGKKTTKRSAKKKASR